MHKFNVTYEVVTQESAEHGETDSRGFLSTDISLRDAISEAGSGYPEANVCGGFGRVRWVTLTKDPDFRTGAQESRSIHIPKSVSIYSSRRIARLLGANL